MNTAMQVGSEIKAVDEIVHALDVTIRATAPEAPLPEAFSCVKHGAEFLEDHLRRLYRLEESGGLLDLIILIHPELAHEVERLEHEHEAIRNEAHRLVLALENASQPTDAELHDILRQLRHLISGILRHEHHEQAILVESVNRVDGGEG
jgi:hypothetical protein